MTAGPSPQTSHRASVIQGPGRYHKQSSLASSEFASIISEEEKEADEAEDRVSALAPSVDGGEGSGYRRFSVQQVQQHCPRGRVGALMVQQILDRVIPGSSRASNWKPPATVVGVAGTVGDKQRRRAVDAPSCKAAVCCTPGKGWRRPLDGRRSKKGAGLPAYDPLNAWATKSPRPAAPMIGGPLTSPTGAIIVCSSRPRTRERVPASGASVDDAKGGRAHSGLPSGLHPGLVGLMATTDEDRLVNANLHGHGRHTLTVVTGSTPSPPPQSARNRGFHRAMTSHFTGGEHISETVESPWPFDGVKPTPTGAMPGRGRRPSVQVLSNPVLAGGNIAPPAKSVSLQIGFPLDSGFNSPLVKTSGRGKHLAACAPLKMPLCGRLKQLEQRHFERKQLEREKREQELRKRQFEALPKNETEVLRKVFKIFVPQRDGEMEAWDVHNCLREMGLGGVSPQEKREVAKIASAEALAPRKFIIEDFAFVILAAVRQKINELRSDEMLRHFFRYDVDGSGVLDHEECAEVARTFGIDCRQVTKAHKDIIQIDHAMGLDKASEYQAYMKSIDSEEELLLGNRTEVEFEMFKRVISKVRERLERIVRFKEREVQDQTGLSEEVFQEFRPDIVSLYDIFTRNDNDNSGSLDRSELAFILKEFGLAPQTPNERRDIEDVLDEVDKDDTGEIDFHEFVHLVQTLRSMRLTKRHDAALAIFERYDRDNSGALSIPEVSQLLADLGLEPTNRREQEEFAHLIDMEDMDGSGTIDFDEMQSLCQRVDEKLKTTQYEAEVERAMLLGFSEGQLREMRGVFDSWDESGCSTLEMAEVRQVLSAIEKQVPQQQFEQMWSQLDPEGLEAIGFLEFLELIKMIRDAEFSEEPVLRLPRKAEDLELRILRSVLGIFKISKVYINSLSKADLVEIFNDYFCLSPDANLHKELGLSSVADLLRYAGEREADIAKEYGERERLR